MKKRMTIYIITGVILIMMLFINSTNFNLRTEPVNEPIGNGMTLEYTHYEYLSYEDADNPPSTLEIEVIEDGITYRGVVEFSGTKTRNTATQQYILTYVGTLVEIDD